MTFRLTLNPILCDGRGTCADLIPERVALDDWGFPIVRSTIDPSLESVARDACDHCPTGALKLERA